MLRDVTSRGTPRKLPGKPRTAKCRVCRNTLGYEDTLNVCQGCCQPRPCACGCNKILTNSGSLYVQGHSPAQRSKEAHAKQAAAISGDLNPAKRKDVRKRIAASVKANHPSKLYPEKWRKHGQYLSTTSLTKVSKVEEAVAPFLPAFARQYSVGYYSLDFAMPDLRVAVEVIGCWHHVCLSCFPEGAVSHTQKLTLRNDRDRTLYLTDLGWLILFVWSHSVEALGPAGAIEEMFTYSYKVLSDSNAQGQSALIQAAERNMSVYDNLNGL